MNRRTFLKAAGGSLTTLAVSADQALGSAPAPMPRAQSSSASSGADVVVIGAGAFGGWTALYLREMGLSVTMIDAYGPGNSRASSGGETRQIRPGYGDREIYTRWVIEALQRWNARQAEWGKTLFYQTGELSLAREWTANLKDSKIVLDRLGVENHVIPHDDLVRRFPQVNVDGIDFGFYVPSTGVLKAREGCVAVAQAFQKKGGRLIAAKAEPGAQAGGRLRDVKLATGSMASAQTFVFACGPWLPKVFPDVMTKKLVTPRREEFFIGTPPGDERFTYPNFPNWAVGGAYGFPSIEGRGFKIAPAFEDVFVDPDTQERIVTPAEVAKVRQFVATWFPALRSQPIVETKVCQYENSVDEHFIVDRHPAFENVWLVGGGSGHGYKHGIMLGDYVAHRVVGKDKHPEFASTFTLKAQTF
jgi:glycine/D-amino acid oxidase-like deaminating enzyme